MSIKTTARKVAAIFDQQKSVQRTNDSGSAAAGLRTVGSTAQVAEVVANAVDHPKVPTAPAAGVAEKSAAPSLNLSALRGPGLKARVPVVVAALVIAPAPASAPRKETRAVVSAPPVVEAPIQPAPAAPAQAVHQTAAEESLAAMLLEIARMPAADIKKIVEQLAKQSTEQTPAAAEPALQDGEIPGSRVPLFAAPEPEILTNPETGESISREEFNRREAEAMSRVLRERAGWRSPNQQSALVHSRPTGKDTWTRR
jgi:hypothetical protein